MLLTETLESVTPEVARRAAASNNLNFPYNMLMQMKRIELNDRNLETLQEMDVEQVDSVSAHSDTPDENEYQSSSAFADVGAFLYVANNQQNQSCEIAQDSDLHNSPMPHVFNLVWFVSYFNI